MLRVVCASCFMLQVSCLMSLVLYRKYRPKTFGEISGQDHIVQTLTNAIKSDSVAHAYLFCGPRGTGKTTMARLLAKAVNCTNLSKVLEKNFDDKLSVRRSFSEGGLSVEPCNQCEACESINNGSALDIVEIDAASNRGINEIRDLKEGIRFAPTILKYKVFIIDEVHMLTKEAFNALLKTLEEPPAHAIFILATTEANKVPTTILSRCQRFDFRKISSDKIVKRLEDMAKKEGVKCEDEVINFIASISDGGLRDAESLLGQAISISGKEINLATIRDALGIADMQNVYEFVDLLAQNNTSEILKYINNLYAEGADMAEFIRSLSNYLRKMMICQIDNLLVAVVAKDMTKEQQANLCAQAGKFESAKIHKFVARLMDAENQMKKSFSPIIPIELAIIDILGL